MISSHCSLIPARPYPGTRVTGWMRSIWSLVSITGFFPLFSWQFLVVRCLQRHNVDNQISPFSSTHSVFITKPTHPSTMKNPVDIFCFVAFPHQNDDSPRIFAPHSRISTFLVTHGPNFILGNFTGEGVAAAYDGSLINLSVVQPSANVVDNVLCPSDYTRVYSWLSDTKNAKDGDVLSVERLGDGSSGMIFSTNFLTPLTLDQDHPFLSVGIVNYEYRNPDDVNDGPPTPAYWASLTWNLSSFLPTDDSIFSFREVNTMVYKIQYNGADNNNTNSGWCENADVAAVTFVPFSLDNFTFADIPTVSCEAYQWLDRKIKDEKRTTTKVAKVLGSILAIAILAIMVLGCVIVRLLQSQQKASSSAV
jgi:hypothetical protein